MPVPRLLLLPVPVVAGMFVVYEAGFAQDKPAWYRKHVANEYKQASHTLSHTLKAALSRLEAAASSPLLLTVWVRLCVVVRAVRRRGVTCATRRRAIRGSLCTASRPPYPRSGRTSCHRPADTERSAQQRSARALRTGLSVQQSDHYTSTIISTPTYSAAR